MKLKENKGMSLIVFTVIFAILLLIAICITVYLLKNSTNETVEPQNTTQAVESNSLEIVKNETAKNTIANTISEENVAKSETTTKKEVEVLGLSTKFVKLSDAAIYTKTLDKNNKTFEYNLNNDGSKNKLLIDLEKNTIKDDNNSELSNAFLGNDKNSHTIYIVDFDKSDSYLDVVIFSKSDDSQEYNIFKNINGKLELLKIEKESFGYGLGVNKIEAYHIYLDGNNKMLYLDEVEENLSPMIATNYYDLKDGIEKIGIDSSNIIDRSFEAKARIYFTTINMFKQHDYVDLKNSHEILPAGTKFKILDVDSETIKVELEDGRIGYIFPKYGYL